jgi:hypothetical protein
LAVVVTARPQAIENATERKKNAESFIDSVVADDTGSVINALRGVIGR